MIKEIPKPNFWRAPVDNDCGSQMQQRYAQWKIASMYADHHEYRKGPYGGLLEPAVEENGDSVKGQCTQITTNTAKALTADCWSRLWRRMVIL